MKLWKLALVAFVAMFLEDVFYTGMTVFESHYNIPFSAVFDELGWITATVCSTLAITELGKHGWHTVKARTLIVAISLANIFGTVAGVLLSRALPHH